MTSTSNLLRSVPHLLWKILERDREFDLILCDVMMPDLSGIDLHRWLGENHPEVAKQLVFITGGAFTPTAREYLGEVDNCSLKKPFDFGRFMEVVDNALRLSRR